MTSKSLTDKHGDVITISDGGLTLATRGHVVVHVKETTPGRVHTAAAYADPAQLRAALDEVATAGSYTRTDEDSGVAAEAPTGSTLAAHFRDKRDMERARAEKAERERDEADTANAGLQAEVDRWKARAEQARPLAADDITDEAHARAADVYQHYTGRSLAGWITKAMLRAALTEPTRPEGAEEIEAIIADQIGGDVGPATIRDLADRIATEVQP